MDNKFWMNVFAVIVAMLLMSWIVRPVFGGVLGLNVKEGGLWGSLECLAERCSGADGNSTINDPGRQA